MPRWPLGSTPRRRLSAQRYALGPSPRPPAPLRVPWRRIGWGVAIACGASALALGGLWLVRGDVLRVRSIDVVGAQAVDARVIAGTADVGGDSLLTLDTEAAAQRVEAVPGVKRAAVHRDWPRGVVIDVTEHQGWGYWQAAGVRTVVDAEGNVPVKARAPAPSAPTIYAIGAGAPLAAGASADRDAVTLVARLLRDGTFERLRLKVERFEFERTRGLTVRAAGSPAVVFGDSRDYEFKVAAWGALLDRIKGEQLRAAEIDLRFGRELVVR